MIHNQMVSCFVPLHFSNILTLFYHNVNKAGLTTTHYKQVNTLAVQYSQLAIQLIKFVFVAQLPFFPYFSSPPPKQPRTVNWKQDSYPNMNIWFLDL